MSKQDAYDSLVELILSGELEPGAPLSERALVGRFGISRTPIRQVLWQLERDELVVLHPNRGAFVKKLGAEEVVELFQIRIALEPLASALAAERRPSAELTHLLDAFQKTEDADSAKTMIHRGESLHDAVIRWSGNQMLIKLYEPLRMQTRLMRNLLYESYASEKTSLMEHRHILEALLDRNAQLARDLMEKHLRRSQSAIMHNLFGPSMAASTGKGPDM